ncbi:hypothetical protein [Pelagibius sp. Alg239-R121]|uniref:hypothetical protein n=1 Tax=Pelagibius sp. Alg239-R121 TaxID=2993448 RepID=UPI0024A68F61|nr:hypothetical protein [Pelagibius sp. Alg239-R121]
MEALFSRDYLYLWALALMLLLFLPVRQLLHVLYVRRAQRVSDLDETETRRLRRRANVTAALLCFVFAVLYSHHLFQGQP